MRPAKNYEPGMRIVYDPARNAVTVFFRGKVRQLEGAYYSEEEARAAAESVCRRLGWKGADAPPAAPRSLLAYRRTG